MFPSPTLVGSRAGRPERLDLADGQRRGKGGEAKKRIGEEQERPRDPVSHLSLIPPSCFSCCFLPKLRVESCGKQTRTRGGQER